MFEPIVKLYEGLEALKTYLVNLGPGRRTPQILEKKQEKAEKLYKNFESLLIALRSEVE